MNQQEIRQLCQKEIDIRIDRMHHLCELGRVEDASALYAEIQQWVAEEDIEIMSIDYLNGII